MIKLLHFADAHIDLARQGRRDAETGLPLRVLDFLRSLDIIVDAAIAEKVDLVIFAGDAYRDRSPAPTYQREWGKRMMKLSEAGIQTLLVVGNHDVSPATGRAHTLQEVAQRDRLVQHRPVAPRGTDRRTDRRTGPRRGIPPRAADLPSVRGSHRARHEATVSISEPLRLKGVERTPGS